jgi:hypothetical protein
MSFGKATTRSRRNMTAAERKTAREQASSKVSTNRSYGSKMEESKTTNKSDVPFFIYKRIVNLEDDTIMDEGASKVSCENAHGCNAAAAIALYSWMMRNVDAWGADQVQTTFFEEDESGLARVTYESMVLMKTGEQQKISAEFYGRAC